MMTDQPSLEYDVFISYARADGRDEADRLYQEFNGAGLKAWRDERSIDPYQDFSGEIEIAIEKSQYVVVCLTPSLLAHYDDRTGKRKDSFVRREIIYAQGCEKPIIPLVFPNFPKGKVPTLINHLTWLDFTNFGKGFADLMARLREGVEYEARETDDPYYDYLVGLQKSIVRFLDSTVFTLLALHTAPTPDAVNAPPREVKARNLPMQFGGFDFAALPVKKTTVAAVEEVIQSPPAIFNDFPAAFEHYGGRVLLLGEPGAGKTTTLMAYAREAVAARLENAYLPLPLVARIVNWDAKQQPPLAEWLSAMGGMDFSNEISAGRTLLLLDGLDELGHERKSTISLRSLAGNEVKLEGETFDPRKRFIGAIADVPKTNLVLVSCRIDDYNNIGTKLPLNGAVTLEPLDDIQLEEYLKEDATLLAAILADTELRDMSRTPLLLSILTFAFRGLSGQEQLLRDFAVGSGDLRDKIFETYISRRYEHERLKPYVDLPYSLADMTTALGYLGLYSVLHQESEFNLDFVMRVAGIDDASSLTEQAVRLHLLNLDEEFLYEGEKVFRFIHLLLREYFAFQAAIEVLDQGYSAPTAIYTLAALTDPRGMSLINQLLPSDDFATFMAAAETMADLNAISALDIIVQRLDDFDCHHRAEIADVILDYGILAIDPLTDLLFSADSWLHRDIISLLEKIGTPQAVAAVKDWERWQHASKKGQS